MTAGSGSPGTAQPRLVAQLRVQLSGGRRKVDTGSCPLRTRTLGLCLRIEFPNLVRQFLSHSVSILSDHGPTAFVLALSSWTIRLLASTHATV